METLNLKPRNGKLVKPAATWFNTVHTSSYPRCNPAITIASIAHD